MTIDILSVDLRTTFCGSYIQNIMKFGVG